MSKKHIIFDLKMSKKYGRYTKFSNILDNESESEDKEWSQIPKRVTYDIPDIFKESVLENGFINDKLQQYLKHNKNQHLIQFYNDYKYFITINSENIRKKQGLWIKNAYLEKNGKRRLIKIIGNESIIKFNKKKSNFEKNVFDGILHQVLLHIKCEVWPKFIQKERNKQ